MSWRANSTKIAAQPNPKKGMTGCGIFAFPLAWLLVFSKLGGPYTQSSPCICTQHDRFYESRFRKKIAVVGCPAFSRLLSLYILQAGLLSCPIAQSRRRALHDMPCKRCFGCRTLIFDARGCFGSRWINIKMSLFPFSFLLFFSQSSWVGVARLFSSYD